MLLDTIQTSFVYVNFNRLIRAFIKTFDAIQPFPLLSGFAVFFPHRKSKGGVRTAKHFHASSHGVSSGEARTRCLRKASNGQRHKSHSWFHILRINTAIPRILWISLPGVAPHHNFLLIVRVLRDLELWVTLINRCRQLRASSEAALGYNSILVRHSTFKLSNWIRRIFSELI